MNFLLLFFSLTVWAADKDPRPDMHVLAKEIASMEKFLISDQQFNAPENEATIKGSLLKLNLHLKNLETSAFSQDPALQVNLHLLTNHLNDADKYFKEGNKGFARYMIQSSLSMCIACHTRGKTSDFALPPVDMKNASSLDQAEYYFATRQFDLGRKVYEGIVSEYPQNKLGPFKLRRALLSLAIYYARVKEAPKEGAKYFKSINTKNFPIYLQKEVQSWAEDFKAWSSEKNPIKKTATESELLAQAKKILRSDDLGMIGDNDRKFHIRRLRASAILHKVLEAPGEKSPVKGEALLYLGQIYHRIAYQLFFRFGEMYLRACIMDYKKTKNSRDCYIALEQAVTEGYTGSAGTSIPEDEEVELSKLKQMAF